MISDATRWRIRYLRRLAHRDAILWFGYWALTASASLDRRALTRRQRRSKIRGMEISHTDRSDKCPTE